MHHQDRPGAGPSGNRLLEALYDFRSLVAATSRQPGIQLAVGNGDRNLTRRRLDFKVDGLVSSSGRRRCMAATLPNCQKYANTSAIQVIRNADPSQTSRRTRSRVTGGIPLVSKEMLQLRIRAAGQRWLKCSPLLFGVARCFDPGVASMSDL